MSLYHHTLPATIRALNNLSAILDKGAAFAVEKKIDPSILINARLAPDMFALARQVQIACDIAKGGGARLAGIENPSFTDDEATFDELKARIAKTIAFLKTLTPAQIDGKEAAEIHLKVGGQEMNFTGLQYAQGFVLPNVYFHSTIAYSILRHNGVDVGKKDFLGSI